MSQFEPKQTHLLAGNGPCLELLCEEEPSKAGNTGPRLLYQKMTLASGWKMACGREPGSQKAKCGAHCSDQGRTHELTPGTATPDPSASPSEHWREEYGSY